MANNITQRRDLTRALSFGEMDRNWDELIELINDIHGVDGVIERIDALNKESLGLDQVDNTSDIDKPISYATQNALDLKADKNTTQTELNKKVETSRSVSTGTGLTGGGNLSTNRTLSIDTTYSPNTSFNLGTQNLNDIQTPGFYHQMANANALTSRNYPTQHAGALLVLNAAGVVQEYTCYNSGNKYYRGYYGSSWNPWREVYHSGNDSTSGVVPKGGIIMWSGSTSNIPSGWALCNGANGTPDLRGRFVIGAGGSYSPGNTGNGSIPSHSHGVGSLATNSTGSHSHSGTAASAGNHNHTMSTAGNHTHNFTSVNYRSGGPMFRDRGYAENSTRSTSAAGAHTHTIWSAGAHTHSVSTNDTGNHTHTISGSTATYGSGSEVIAKYYALCYIMKL